MTVSRAEVYGVIDGERAYQEEQKLSDGRWRDGKVTEQTPEDFLLYMNIYLGRASKAVYDADPEEVLHAVRKVTALGVACMEKFGAPGR